MRTAVVWMCSLLIATSSLAAEGSGEARRLTEQLRGYIDRSAYPAADRTFRAMSELNGVKLTADDLFMGAESARALGNMNACQERLLAAFRLALNEEVKIDERARAWLAELNDSYGRVDVYSKGAGTLAPEMQPFQSDRRAAIAHADARIAETGRFEGLLPVGSYTWGKSDFVVEAGSEPVKIKIKGPKKKK